MKNYLIILCLALAGNLFSANITAYLTSATFNIPDKEPYLETYLSVIGNTVKFVKNENGKFQGAIDVSVAFRLNGEIKNAQKYTLSSPEIADTSKGLPNFIDQQRFVLANGLYEMEISIADKNSINAKPFTAKMPIKIDFPLDRITISDVQLLESFTKSITPSILTKSGYDLMPYVATFYPENITKFKFYAEIYNAKKILGENQKMLISYYLKNEETKVKLNEFSAFSKQMANDANILLAELNIETLPTGKYEFIIEVRDAQNKIQAEQTVNLDRQNKQAAFSFDDLNAIKVEGTFVSNYKNLDTLSQYLRCLRPISSSAEIQYSENQLKGKDIITMQQYLYNFWQSRYPIGPEYAWLEYYKEVQKVNKEYATYGLKGYETDRGRVYLQYGPPDSRQKFENEPSSYPYEIWQYNSLNDKTQALTNPYNRQSNKSFVFYNPDLASNKYKLLHSNARGEILNSRWEIDLHKRDSQSGNMDVEKPSEHFGGNVDDNFKNPR